MVLEVGTDSLVLNLAFHSSRAQHRRVSNPAQLQDLGTLDRAAGDDDLAASLDGMGFAFVDEVGARRFVAVELNR